VCQSCSTGTHWAELYSPDVTSTLPHCGAIKVKQGRGDVSEDDGDKNGNWDFYREEFIHSCIVNITRLVY